MSSTRRRKLIGELYAHNKYYGERAEAAFERGDDEKGIKYGHIAEANLDAARALEDGKSFSYVNDRWNNILDM